MPREAQPLRVVGGRYKLLAELESGGFGRVWKAHDEALGVDVAVKEVRLPPDLSEAERSRLLARARREARNAAKLRDDPHIVAVHDLVMEGDVPWVVMRLVAGRSLDKRLREHGRLRGGEAVHVATALLNALRAAHAVGIVHRDVKPANVLLADNGQVLLTDFGIAVQQADTALTGSRELIGTLGYIAPERLEGREGNPASDLFSLGVTLYQAVEGSLPFRAETPAAIVRAVLDDAPAPPRHGGVLSPVIMRLLAKDPRSRPTPDQALRLLGSPPPAGPPPTRPLPKKKTTIVITRERRPQLAIRGFEILIDSALAGTIRNGARKEFDVRPGSHTVAVRSGEYSGPEVPVHLAEGDRCALIAGPVLGGTRIKAVSLRPAPPGGTSATGNQPAWLVLAALGGACFVAVCILVSLYHSNRSFADRVSGYGDLSGNAVNVSAGSCLHYIPGSDVTWVSVPCFAASADYTVLGRQTFPTAEQPDYSSYCTSKNADGEAEIPLVFPPGTTGSDDVELCLWPKSASWNPAG